MRVERLLLLPIHAVAGVLLLVPPVARATIYHLSPRDDWFNIISSDTLLPGDEVVLSGGVYSDNRRMSIGHRGTAQEPITIRAAEGAMVRITRPNAFQNVINVEGAQYLTLRDFEITGGSIGLRINEKNGFQPQSITIENLHVHNTGAGAITANRDGNLYDGLVFRGNHIHDTGDGGAGFYLGCNNASDGSTACVFRNGLVEGNYVHDLVGGVGDGIQIKDGSYNNIVRDNVVHTTGTAGAVGILVYGTDGNPPNVVERNVIWEAGDNAIQAASEAIIRNNIIFGAAFDGIRSQNHQSAVPGNLTIVNNTVISQNDAISIGTPSGGRLSGPIVIANNAVYPESTADFALRLANVDGITVAGNVGQGRVTPSQGPAAWLRSGNLFNDLADIGARNAFPTANSLLVGNADATFLPNDDFNTTPRGERPDVGAYVYRAAGNPGWAVSTDFKRFPVPVAGDMDFDYDADFDDIYDFVLGMNEAADYATKYGVSPAAQGDMDGDGDFDFDDIPGFVLLLGGTAELRTVPEPASALLTAIGACLFCCGRAPLHGRLCVSELDSATGAFRFCRSYGAVASGVARAMVSSTSQRSAL